MAHQLPDHPVVELNVRVPAPIVLRPIEAGDWPSVHNWASTDAASRYQAWGPNTERETQQFVDAAVAAWKQDPIDRYVHVAEDDGRTVVGLGELKVHSRRWQHGVIGYVVHVDHWGRGIATAIATALVDHAFAPPLALHRVTATCDPRNRASAAVLERIGMTREVRLRDTMRIRDGWRDSDAYCLLHDEWSRDD